jgi:hypothetical protein
MSIHHAPGCPAFRAKYGVCSCGAYERAGAGAMSDDDGDIAAWAAWQKQGKPGPHGPGCSHAATAKDTLTRLRQHVVALPPLHSFKDAVLLLIDAELEAK